MIETKETTHPAYGMAGFHRVTGNPGNLFGSSVECEHFIELEIKPGVEVEEGCYHAFHGNGRPYIRVAFSPAQFAELLTSMNIGDGVPCTIRRLNNQEVENIPNEIHVHELDRQKKNFKEKVNKIKENLTNKSNRVKELLALPKLNKEQKKELASILDSGIVEIGMNIPFYMELFDEATDKIVQEAKAEIDATVQHCIMDAGIKALGMEFKQKQIAVNDDEEHLDEGDSIERESVGIVYDYNTMEKVK